MVDEDLVVVPEADAFLRHVRFGRDQAEPTTRTYAGHIALYLRWCIRTGRDRRVAAEELGLFVVRPKFGTKAITGIERPATTGLAHPGPGAGPVREPARIQNVLTGARQFLLHGITARAVPSQVMARLHEAADSWDLPERARGEELTGYRMRPRHRVPGARCRGRRASGPPTARSWGCSWRLATLATGSSCCCSAGPGRVREAPPACAARICTSCRTRRRSAARRGAPTCTHCGGTTRTGPVPLPTAEQGAVIDPAGAGDEVAELWRDDPAKAAGLVREPAACGECTAAEVLDAAVDAAIGAGLPALNDAGKAPDPSMMAEQRLEAVPYLVLAVALASADLD
ncbi:hypothetical protein ACIQF6_36015 [Kitasatospora sp. NPDC092948]|uniref:hypothetical protein n=1 Tax=Kitasatospora sp. NPDC092948 TaxID=3364088 RepID=UPI0038136FF9